MKKIAALGMMAAAMMGVANPAVSSNQNTAQRTHQAQQDQIKPEVTAEPVAARKSKLGTGGYVFRKPGIPPHIYGMFHVRRGSHRRTNK